MSKTALKKAAVKKCRDDKVENLRRCSINLSNKLSVLNTDSSEYENMIMKLALAEQEEKEKQKEEVSFNFGLVKL